MSHTHPSIQSIYQKDFPVEKECTSLQLLNKGDGFTETELTGALNPLDREWNPQREYEQMIISRLIPGPRAISFAGRLVNVNTFFGQTPKQPKATGWHYLILKDDTAAISIKLFFANKQYPLKLGQFISVWTSFISDSAKTNTIAIKGVFVHANLFPGRVTSDHIIIHTTSSTQGICRTPLDYRKGQPLAELMAVSNYLASGHDGVVDVKLLVCVKSIGAKRRITRKSGTGELEVAEILLFDHTGEIRTSLWNEMIDSVADWQAGKTILLISDPEYKVGYSGRGAFKITHRTMIDVDPECADADWLRKFALGLGKRESLCLEIPDGVWDVEATEYGVSRMLFTLAELDIWVRADPRQVFTGFINLVIMELSLVTLHRRSMLMCAECCGVPVFSNSLASACRSCSRPLALTLNPRIIGTMMDETGCIEQGKVVWSKRAWEQLFGRSVEEVTAWTSEEVAVFEERLLFVRLHFSFGWAESVGRLVVLGVFR